MRARRIGHVIVNTAVDRPWSQYFCCLLEAYRENVRKNPVATKRALRAILKRRDVCATEPERAGATTCRWRFHPQLRLTPCKRSTNDTTNGVNM